MQTNDIYTNVIVPFIEGQDIISFKNSLAVFTQSRQLDAIHHIKIILDADDEQQIISKFTNNAETRKKYLREYYAWLEKTNVSNHLIHLLEFLAQNKSPRLRYLLKQIHNSKVKQNYTTTIISSLALTLISFTYFTVSNPEWANQVKSFERFLSLALKTIIKTQHLALLILMFQLIKYCIEIYYILKNNSTTPKHKLDKLLRKSLTTLINIMAQILVILNPSVMPKIANNLLVLSELINILFSAWTLFQLKQTKKPSKDENLSLEIKIHQLENYYYYLRKTAQFRLECTSLLLSFTVSMVSMFLSSHVVWLAPVCLLLQFFISQIKNLYHSHLDDKYTNLTQNEIKEMNGRSVSKASSISFFSNEQNASRQLPEPDGNLSLTNMVTPV